MLIIHKGTFGKGMALMISFIAVFVLIMMPLYGGRNGLDVADNFFNELSKDSSNYFDQVKSEIDKSGVAGLDITVKLAKPEEAAAAAAAFTGLGAAAEAKDADLTVKGDLKPLLGVILDKCKTIYAVGPEQMAAGQGKEDRQAVKAVWAAFNAMIKPLQKEKKLAEAKLLGTVSKKAMEPAYNFYGIQGKPVMEGLVALTGLLVFYVIYTMWYGYAIFFLFDGIGLSMKKSKVKKEV